MEIGPGISFGGGINYEADTTPIYSFRTTPTSINEGQSGSFVVNTVYVANNTTLYWTILNTSTSNLDFPSPFSGSFTITNGIGSFTVTPETDNTTEGSQTFTIQIRTSSTSGDIVLTSNSITVNDTSLTAAMTAELLIVGGGGGGGTSGSNGSGGGGGAGGLFYQPSVSVSPSTTYTIIVGSGGSGDPGGFGNRSSTNPATPGNLSSALGYTALGGGRGGSPGTIANGYGSNGTALNGGSGGGGAGGGAIAGSGLQPTSASGGYGNGGGTGIVTGSGTQVGQGGGGAGAAGQGGGGSPGNGGIGRAYSISGTSQYYAGGGASGQGSGAAAGTGGNGGGGNGGAAYSNGNNATYYGGGGGGAGKNYPSPANAGGSGYQGIVIIKYLDTFTAATSTTGSPTITTAGGYRTYTFTASGSITF
jgi:hypothetical protein